MKPGTTVEQPIAKQPHGSTDSVCSACKRKFSERDLDMGIVPIREIEKMN
jgi:hypothetical protein